MTDLRERPLRLEVFLTRDYINRAVKMREIEARLEREQHYRGLKLAAIWAGAIGGSWALVWLLIFGLSWVLQ